MQRARLRSIGEPQRVTRTDASSMRATRMTACLKNLGLGSRGDARRDPSANSSSYRACAARRSAARLAALIDAGET